MSTVAITVTAPGGSPSDITNDVLFGRSTFEQQMNAVPGSFNIVVRDPTRVRSFVVGSEIQLEVDGSLLFGGYVTQIGMVHLAPAADTSNLSTYELRAWNLRGADYNILFDKRVWRNPANYLKLIDLTAQTTDGAILRTLIDSYSDMGGFDSSGIVNIASIPGGDLAEQGQKIREKFTALSQIGGAVWYIHPDKTVRYMPYDDAEKRWGFSDVPNYDAITATEGFQGALWPFRSVEAVEDGSFMVNDALIWGGSEFAGSGGTVFARVQNATSISTHNRWQVGETHFGQRWYRQQAGVDARANVIVNGPPGTDAHGETKGLRFPQWNFTFAWFSDRVPMLSGVRDHIRPGDLVTVNLQTHGVTKLLPLRTLRISFPNALEAGDATHLVQFDGTFGMQLNDPFNLWAYLLNAESRVAAIVPTTTTVTDTSTVTVYGAFFTGEPTPATDGVTTVFSIPFGYIVGTFEVYINGLFQRRGIDFTESNPEAGQFTMTTAPQTADNLWVTCSTLES